MLDALLTLPPWLIRSPGLGLALALVGGRWRGRSHRRLIDRRRLD